MFNNYFHFPKQPIEAPSRLLGVFEIDLENNCTMKTIAKTLSLILIAIMTFAAAPALKAADHSDEAKAIKMRLIGTDHVNAGSALTAELTATLTTDAQLMVTNAEGKVFATTQLVVDEGANRVKLNVSDIPSGVYFIKLSAAGKRETLTFVVH